MARAPATARVPRVISRQAARDIRVGKRMGALKGVGKQGVRVAGRKGAGTKETI